MERFRWDGAVIWVTGASDGIGAATARVCAERGALLVLSARRGDRLDAVRGSLSRPDQHLSAPVDVTDVGSVKDAARAIEQRFGRLDAVVANAGFGDFRRVEEIEDPDLARLVETNLTGVVRTIQAALPLLRRAQHARRIVIVSSAVARRGVPGLGVYSATKWALHGLADALRVELAPDDVQVSLVAPGATKTGFHSAASGSPPAAPPRNAIDATVVGRAIARAIDRAPVVIDVRPIFRWIGVLNLIWPRLLDARLRKRLPPR